MRSFLFLTILFFLSLLSAFSQNPFPRGTYMSCDELRRRQPTSYDTFEIQKRSDGDIAMVGGNDYKVSSETKSISNKIINKEIFAISIGDSLFINCFRLGLQPKYTLAKYDSDLFFFTAGIPSSKNSDVYAASYFLGPIGGGIAGANAALKRFPYIMSLQDCRAIILTRESFTYLLHPHTELYEKFRKEKDKDSDSTLIKYYREYLKIY